MSTIRPLIESAMAAAQVRNRIAGDAGAAWQRQLNSPASALRAAEQLSGSIAAVTSAQRVADQLSAARLTPKDVLGGVAMRLASVTQEIARAAAAVQAELAAALRPAALAIVDWQKWFEELDEERRGVADALHRDGWWAAPSWPMTRARRLVDFRRKNGKRALDRLVCEIYRAENFSELREMVDSWMVHPEFKRRRSIIRAALKLHTEGVYVASVPTLLPLVEGVAFDAFGPTANPKNVDVSALCRTKAEDEEFRGLLAEGLNTALDLLYGFTSFDKVPPRSRRLNRHAISHGRTVGYGTEANSLRVFLALDQLAFLVRMKRQREDESKVA